MGDEWLVLDRREIPEDVGPEVSGITRNCGCVLAFNLGSRSRLSRLKASAIREFTVPSGISRISAILASLRSS